MTATGAEDTPAAPPTPTRQDLRRVVTASFIGTAIEWYDFFIFGTAAALIFGPQFFPSSSSNAETLLAFSTFAVGFAARPLGAMVMGHFGDRIGRKSMLVVSLTTMGLATFLIGCLPTHEQIGAWAPILLVALRCLQGFVVGGEWGGAVLMAVEYAPHNRRGLYGAVAPMGTPAGVILSNLVFLCVTAAISEEAFTGWGWRIPFLLSALLVFVGLVIRLKIEESPVYAKLRDEEQQKKPQAPIVEVLKTHSKQVVLGALAFAGSNGFGYILIAYVLSYGTTQLGMSRSMMLTCVLIGAAAWLVTCLVFGSMSDQVGRRRVYFWGTAIGLAWAFPFFLLVDTAKPVWITLAMVVLSVPLAATFSPLAAMFAEMFPTRIRYTGTSLAYQFGAVIGGGLTPLVAVALLNATGTSISISAYLFAGLAVGVVAVLFIPETSRRSLDGKDFEDDVPAPAVVSLAACSNRADESFEAAYPERAQVVLRPAAIERGKAWGCC